MRVVSAGGLGVLVAVLVGCGNGQGEGGEGDQGVSEAMVCRDLRPGVAATIRRGFPEGWSMASAQVVMANDLKRDHDGAPSEVVAAIVHDEAGSPVYDTPVLWVVEGGTEPRFETLPKSFLLLNDVSRELMDVIIETGREQGRQSRYWPDATSPGVGWSLEHPAVILALECLAEGS